MVISLDGVVPALTDARRGVLFDMLPDGKPEQTARTRADRNDAFLALDRNRNGQIDSSKELFCSTTISRLQRSEVDSTHFQFDNNKGQRD